MIFKSLILVLIGSLLMINAELPNPKYTRTMLKVARSLPGETEELKVRTAEGNVATLIVKRREKAENLQRSSNQNFGENSSLNVTQKQLKNITEINHDVSSSKNDTKSRSDFPNEKLNEPTLFRLETHNPQNNEKREDSGSWTPLGSDGRALNNIDATTETYLNWKPLLSDSIKPTTEERTNYGLLFARNFEEDREERTFNKNEEKESGRGTFTFLPHYPRPLTRTNIGANLSKNRGGKDVPPEVTIRSEINVKSLPKRKPMSLDTDGTPVIHGVRVPDEPIDKIQTWRNARVINNKLISDSSTSVTIEPDTSTSHPENLAEKQRFDRFFQDVNRSTHQQALTPELWLRRFGRDFDEEPRNIYFEWDPTSHRNTALNADVYETKNENYRSNIQKRMLHPEAAQSYPNSPVYTPESQKIAPLTLKPGARAPVLQYAHPELGVQPAKILKSEKKRPDNFPDNQNSFTEQRHKKKYVLNDKTVIDSYNTKNYYPNQHFYGLKHSVEPPFWMKISENLKNQFSTGVERVSQFTKPVFDPLVEATQKISQNLGLSRAQEAQQKIGTVASGSSILIPALGLVASGAALGIGAVAVGRYLDVDVLKRSNENQEYIQELENQRALHGIHESTRSFAGAQENVRNVKNSEASMGNLRNNHPANSPNEESLISAQGEKTMNSEEIKNRELRGEDDRFQPMLRSDSRIRRSLDDLDVFKADEKMENLVRSKRMRRTGPDSMMDIIEIDIPTRKSRKDILLIVKEDELSSLNGLNTENLRRKKRFSRSIDSDRELEDAYQNLENAEVTEVAHISGDWTNTPCAKRIFCDAMIQRGHDSSIFMEKKMASLLSLIHPEAAFQVSGHFHEVMEAVRTHDCSRFFCPQTRPGNVFF